MLPEIWSAQWTEHFVILDQFLPFYPSKHLENKNFENMKKIPGDIIVLHMRTINDNDMMYVCSDMERKRTFRYFGPFFALLPTTTQKIKILKI